MNFSSLQLQKQLVGVAAVKGIKSNGRVYRHRGGRSVGTFFCRLAVNTYETLSTQTVTQIGACLQYSSFREIWPRGSCTQRYGIVLLAKNIYCIRVTYVVIVYSCVTARYYSMLGTCTKMVCFPRRPESLGTAVWI